VLEPLEGGELLGELGELGGLGIDGPLGGLGIPGVEGELGGLGKLGLDGLDGLGGLGKLGGLDGGGELFELQPLIAKSRHAARAMPLNAVVTGKAVVAGLIEVRFKTASRIRRCNPPTIALRA
jgi:hypothetical protein